MPTLTDTQLVILSAACQRPGRLVLPLSERIKGGAAQKVVAALIARGLVEEVEASQHDQIWRTTGEGPAVTLVATDAALAALGMEADSAHTSLVERPQGVAAQDGARIPQAATLVPLPMFFRPHPTPPSTYDVRDRITNDSRDSTSFRTGS